MKLKLAAEVALLVLADLGALVLAYELSSFLRSEVLPLLFSAYSIKYIHRQLIDIWWMLLIWLFFLSYEGLYTRILSFWDEMKSIWKVSFYSLVAIFTIVSLGKLTGEVSRTVIMMMGGFSFIMLPSLRYIFKTLMRRAGLLRRNTLIIGAGETGSMVLKALMAEPNFGYRILGVIDDNAPRGSRVGGVKVHSGLRNIDRYIRTSSVQDIFIAMPEENWSGLKKLINSLQYQAERVFWIPGFSGIAAIETRVQHFFHEQVMALEIKNNLNKFFNVLLKRISDIVMCALLLPFLMPVLAIIYFAIRLDSRGPALYTHQRIGKGGREFRCMKFRTMYEDADRRLKDILESSPEAREEWEKHWKLRNDPRVTRVGRLLRKTSLDELPQIFNVLSGRMSLVGPRPYLQREWDSLREHSETILSVRPGITGLWQVSGRSSSTYENRLSQDAWYVRNWNPWMDIIIILKTFRVVFMREGAW